MPNQRKAAALGSPGASYPALPGGVHASAIVVVGIPPDHAGNYRKVAIEIMTPAESCPISTLLLGPGIGQRVGELCGGEIGRRGAVEEGRYDAG
jgi:hypothetical protein